MARAPTFLFICDEWSPTRGGISRFNRSYASAFALAGHRTMCLVTSASEDEHRDANAHGVRLVEAVRTPSGPNLFVPCRLVVNDEPDVVIGHDAVTGAVAWAYAREYLRTASLVHIVHTAPAENEPYKRGDDATRRTEARERELRRVAADAHVVAAVGPRLTRNARSIIGHGSVVQLDPGLTVPDELADIHRVAPPKPTVLVLGRTEHILPKGLDIAAHAVAALAVPDDTPQPVLFIRGAPPDRCDWLRRQLVEQTTVARDRIDVRPFTDDLDQLGHDLGRATMCVLPSRVEGFGLAALEAIEVGTPVLVSDKSGLAETLRARLGPAADRMIVRVVDDLSVDVPRWGAAIQRVLDDVPAAFAYAHEVRTSLQAAMPWDATVRTLVERL
jgi:glycosyltransferase involved in cell wall biosynthesis